LETCRADQQALEVRTYMEERNFDVMGLVDGDTISRYVSRKRLGKGTCHDNGIPIEPREIVSSTTALVDLLRIMKHRDHLFVLGGFKLESIVTSADLQKPPVRMLLFSMVSLLDMFMLVLVKRHYPDELLRSALKPKRLEEVQKLYNLRREMNEEIDLADCLQLADKRDLILKVIAPQRLGFNKREAADKLFKHAEKLRNHLAHSQDLVLGTSWAEVIDLTEQIDGLLQRIEGIIEPSTSVGTIEVA
jgi:hypothetical protein